MTVTRVHKDPGALTLTITSELDSSPERAWQLWADPRQLERWWGPPTYPATVVDHELVPDGRVTYFMTGPDGIIHGYWEVTAVDPPNRLEMRDGFADESGTPKDPMSITTNVVTFAAGDGRKTLMVMEARLASLAAMGKQLEMGAEAAMVAAIGQIDAVLADPA